MADLVPSRYRSFATGSVTFQMCVGAIVFLMLGQALGMRPAFLIAAGTVLAISAAFAFSLREPAASQSHATEATFRSLFDAARSAVRGEIPGMRAIFLASLLLQLTFQTFTTWFALHGTERFGLRPEDVTIGMIAWAVGGVIGALPAGFIGVRIGRRNAPVPRERRGVLAALFLPCMALGGAIGDPLNGALFDGAGSYRPLFLMMTAYTALAFTAVLFVPRGAGEASEREPG